MGVLDSFSRSYLTPSVFSARAFKALAALSGEQVRSRAAGDGTKRLVEEVLPIAAFLRNLEVPDRYPRCRYFPGTHPFDAKLKLKGVEVDDGHLEAEYFIEVTSALSPLAYLKREALTRNGGVLGGNDIERVGIRKHGTDKIVSKAVARNVGEDIQEAISWTREALLKKQAKKYPSPCILLLQVEPDSYPSTDEWATLAKAVRCDVDRKRFRHVFVVHSWTNTVFLI